MATEGLMERDGHQMVRGCIRHERKDHKMLKLYDDVKDQKWFFAFEAVQGQSWGASGRVD